MLSKYDLKSRNITSLFHFTQASNLENIFKHGLLSRNYIEENNIYSEFNDEYRYDNCCNAICTSLEFPNYKMFYKLREEDSSIDWAVIKLDANIICNFSCAFCWDNAANNFERDKPIYIRQTRKAFSELFDVKTGYPERSQTGIPENYPTNPQAEILVFETIPIEYISEICFNDKDTLEKYKDIVPLNIKCSINQMFFRGRCDWSYWQNI